MVDTPVHASWLNQVIQREVLTPNDCASIDELIERIVAFGKRHPALDEPFVWLFKTGSRAST